jgi:hypothetical protein
VKEDVPTIHSKKVGISSSAHILQLADSSRITDAIDCFHLLEMAANKVIQRLSAVDKSRTVDGPFSNPIACGTSLPRIAG